MQPSPPHLALYQQAASGTSLESGAVTALNAVLLKDEALPHFIAALLAQATDATLPLEQQETAVGALAILNHKVGALRKNAQDAPAPPSFLLTHTRGSCCFKVYHPNLETQMAVASSIPVFVNMLRSSDTVMSLLKTDKATPSAKGVTSYTQNAPLILPATPFTSLSSL